MGHVTNEEMRLLESFTAYDGEKDSASMEKLLHTRSGLQLITCDAYRIPFEIAALVLNAQFAQTTKNGKLNAWYI